MTTTNDKDDDGDGANGDRSAPPAEVPAAQVTGYHAHVYFDPDSAESRERAALVRDRVAAAFPGARLGRWHDRPVGPHTRAMYQIAFATGLLPEMLPWLMLNRLGLPVLLHPETGDEYADHSAHAAWLGDKLPLKLAVLKRSTSGSVPDDDAG
jgi:DOPA 4,5-dioxygenase